MIDLIERYYDLSSANEWDRLARHRTEWAITLRALREHLPPPPARVLDCGGGPGRYAIELAKHGYSVTLFDLSRALLSFARTQAHAANATLAGYEHGTATDLSRFADDSFDAILFMGPLYHLIDPDDRGAALREARRVLKPGGMLAAAFISQYAGLRFLLKEDPEFLIRSPERVAGFWQTESFPPARTDGAEFIAHFIPPTEVRPLIESAGFDVRAVLGVEGLASMIDDKLNALEGDAWNAWVSLNYCAAFDPSLHGACEHLLCIAHTPPA
ncbi:MAG: class I SAM-dependent methyltransferase [Chloroflexi bacterium]|nr:class I SAM-dependent methyltransferase [Chloroflexota bacterium]